jgi:hypothetical protein
VIADLAVIEFMAMIIGLREPRRFLRYHADRGIRAAIWSEGERAANISGFLLPG